MEPPAHCGRRGRWQQQRGYSRAASTVSAHSGQGTGPGRSLAGCPRPLTSPISCTLSWPVSPPDLGALLCSSKPSSSLRADPSPTTFGTLPCSPSHLTPAPQIMALLQTSDFYYNPNRPLSSPVSPKACRLWLDLHPTHPVWRFLDSCPLVETGFHGCLSLSIPADLQFCLDLSSGTAGLTLLAWSTAPFLWFPLGTTNTGHWRVLT